MEAREEKLEYDLDELSVVSERPFTRNYYIINYLYTLGGDNRHRRHDGC